MKYVLFNSLSNNSRGESDAKQWASQHYDENAQFVTVIGLDYKKFFEGLTEDDEVVLCGGDGTLNYFVNEIYGFEFKNKLFYVKCGSGNDFYNDVQSYEKDSKVDLLPFIQSLPCVSVNGLKRRFINGIGYGVDGDTCLYGDQIKEQDPSATINYSGIAIGLLLGTFKDSDKNKIAFQPRHAKVTVDGQVAEFDNVWVACAMNGRFYGGGMNAAPNQDRLNNDGTCSLTVLSSKGRILTLLRFPTFSSGKHSGKKFIHSFKGKHITVEFDKPCALQIDGDVVKDVTTYSVDFD